MCHLRAENLQIRNKSNESVTTALFYSVINTKRALHSQYYIYGFAVLVCSVKSKCSSILQRLDWWKS